MENFHGECKMEKDEVNCRFDLIFKMRRILPSLGKKVNSENNVVWGRE